MVIVALGCVRAMEFAKAQLQSRDEASRTDNALSFGEIVGASFALYSPRKAWPFLARTFAIAPARGQAMLAWIAEKIWSGHEAHGWDYLDEAMQADVCEWTRNWRVASGELPVQLGKIDKRILSLLTTYGTEAAISQLERLSRAFPTETALQSRAKKARHKQREWAWRPLLPAEVVALSMER
jgi:hypothetical protein